MEHFKHIPKMSNPSIIVTTAFQMTIDEWKLVYNTVNIVAKKLTEKVKLPIIVTLQDLLDNPHKCTRKEHELVEFDGAEKPCMICVHCLQKFAKADLNDETKNHFFSKLKEDDEKK